MPNEFKQQDFQLSKDLTSKFLAENSPQKIADVATSISGLPSVNVSEQKLTPDERLVAETIFLEAAGEPSLSRLATASILENRASFKNTSLAFEAKKDQQFSVWNDNGEKAMRWRAEGKMTGPAWEESVKFARMAIAGTLPMRSQYTHMYNPETSNPSWKNQLTQTRQIGAMIFGRLEDGLYAKKPR